LRAGCIPTAKVKVQRSKSACTANNPAVQVCVRPSAIGQGTPPSPALLSCTHLLSTYSPTSPWPPAAHPYSSLSSTQCSKASSVPDWWTTLPAGPTAPACTHPSLTPALGGAVNAQQARLSPLHTEAAHMRKPCKPLHQPSSPAPNCRPPSPYLGRWVPSPPVDQQGVTTPCKIPRPVA
jgi:hypothetical protein